MRLARAQRDFEHILKIFALAFLALARNISPLCMASEQKTQQAQADPLADFLIWLDRNKKQVGYSLIAVAVIGAAVGLYVWHKGEKETEANAALFALPSGFTQSRNQQPANGEAFLKVADDYSGTSVAERAELMGAGVLFSSGKYKEAQAAFEKFLNDHPEAPNALRAQASFGVASSLDALGNIDQAVAKYQAVEQQFRGENVVPLAALARGRILEMQNKSEEALKVYQNLESSSSPTDPWRTEAIDRREKLVARHPELASKYTPAPQEQILEVTTPPEGSTNAPTVRVVSNTPPAKATSPKTAPAKP